MREPARPAAPRRQHLGWRARLILIASVFLYMGPLFWLSGKTDYPGSFGISIAEGRGALIEYWRYSYLLLRRHEAWDIVLFVYMWAMVAGLLGWIAVASLRAFEAKYGRLQKHHFRIFDQD